MHIYIILQLRALALEGGVFVVQCGAILDHFQHRILRCSLSKIITAPHLIFAVTYAVRCGLSLAKTITAPHLIFAITYAVRYIRCSLNDLKFVYFSNFGFFLPSPKLIFPFVLVQVLNYCLVFLYFGLAFLISTCQDYHFFFFRGKLRLLNY